MDELTKMRLLQLLELGKRGKDIATQARALDELIYRIFDLIPGVSITERTKPNNINNGKLELAAWNNQDAEGLYFLPNIILFAATGWQESAGGSDLEAFYKRMKALGLPFGVFFAFGGLSTDLEERTETRSILAASLAEELQIIVLTNRDIERINDAAQLVTLFKRKVCELAVS